MGLLNVRPYCFRDIIACDISIVVTHRDAGDIGNVIEPLKPAEVSNPAPVNIYTSSFLHTFEYCFMHALIW